MYLRGAHKVENPKYKVQFSTIPEKPEHWVPLSPKQGMSRVSAYKKSKAHRYMFDRVTPATFQTMLEKTLFESKVASGDATFGLKSHIPIGYHYSKKDWKKFRGFLSVLNQSEQSEQVIDQDTYVKQFPQWSELRDSQNYGNKLGCNPLLYDCTIHGMRFKPFLDTGAYNLPVPTHNTSGRVPLYMGKDAAERSNIAFELMDEPIIIDVANDESMSATHCAINVPMKFGPYTEYVDLYVLPTSTFDIVLGLQWFLSRKAVINEDGSLNIPLHSGLLRVPLTVGNKRIYRTARFVNSYRNARKGKRKSNSLSPDSVLIPDSDETEVHLDYETFKRANDRSLECNIAPQPVYMVKVTKDLKMTMKKVLGDDVLIINPSSEEAAAFDPVDDTTFTTGAAFNNFKVFEEQGIDTSKNVMHEFKSIVNDTPPNQERPPKPGWETKVWEAFDDPMDTLFPQEILPGKGVPIPPIINLEPGTEHERPCRPPMHLPPDHQKELYTQLKYYLEKGWIVPSDSPYGAPVFFVPKKSGKLRIVIDYRAINKLTRKDKFSLPDAEQLLAQLGGANHYSTIDLAHGYHQCILDELDRPKTAFRTLFGSYQWNVLTFGLTNAVPAFIKVMESVLRQYLGICCVCFIDDVLIYTKGTEADHFVDVCNVLQTIQTAGLYVNWVKSEFFVKSVEYLGFYVSPDGVSPIDSKVSAVENWEKPETLYHLRSFLGAVGFYRRFIFGFAKVAKPLYDLTKDRPDRDKVVAQNVTMTKYGRKVNTRSIIKEWTDAHTKAFETLKKALTRAPVLKLPDPDKEYEIMVDGSLYAVGAALMQRHDGQLCPVAFYSHKLSDAEQKYPPYEFELLAIFTAIKHWKYLLMGSKITIYTDHKPLTHLLTQPQLSPRQERWITFLSEFDVDIVAVEGTRNVVADALSRYPINMVEVITDTAAELLSKHKMLLTRSTCYWQYGFANHNSSSYYGYRTSGSGSDRVKTAFNFKGGESRVNYYDKEFFLYAMPCVDQHENDDCSHCIDPAVYFESEVLNVQPEELQTRRNDISSSLIESYEYDQLAQSVLNGDGQLDAPANMTYVEGIVIFTDRDGLERLYIPASASATPKYTVTEHPIEGDEVRLQCTLREELIREAHELTGHLGAGKTLRLLQNYYYWPKMRAHVIDYVRGCKACQRNKSSTTKPYGRLRPLQVPTARWETISLDWITKLPRTLTGYDAILVVVDSYSKRAHFIPTHTTASSAKTAQIFFEYIYKHHGMPAKIVTDRDSKVTSDFWRILFTLLGTNLAMSTPYHPQTDGQTERLNRVLGDMLRWYTLNGESDWDKWLTAAEFAYNNTVHSSTGYTPFQLDCGRTPKDPLAMAATSLLEGLESDIPYEYANSSEKYLSEWHDHLELARSQIHESIDRYEDFYNRRRNEHVFSVGDKVKLDTSDLTFVNRQTGVRGARRKLDERFSGPYTITKVIGKNSAGIGSAFELDLGPDQQFHPVQSIVKLRPFKDSDIYKDAHVEVAPRPIMISHEDVEVEEHEVDTIVTHRGTLDDRLYRVKWKGYNNIHNTWEPRQSLLENAYESVLDYENSLTTLRRSQRLT
jgi:transposase InsO family protein